MKPTQFKAVKLERYSQDIRNGKTVLVKPLTKRGIINTETGELIAYIPDFCPEGTEQGLIAILNNNRTVVLPSLISAPENWIPKTGEWVRLKSNNVVYEFRSMNLGGKCVLRKISTRLNAGHINNIDITEIKPY
jgi:hypothetical protein